MFPSRRRTLGFKLEGTPYTAETLAATDYDFRAFNVAVGPSINEIKRKLASGDYGSFKSIMGKRTCSVTFSIYMNWQGDDGTAPMWGKCVKACAYSENAAANSVTYKPSTTANATPATIEVVDWNEGATPVQVVTKVRGAMGNVKFAIGQIGDPIRMDFEFSGALESITDRAYASRLTPGAYDTPAPDALLSSTITLFTEAQVIDTFEIDTGNVVEISPDPAQATGVRGANVVDREPKMTLDPNLDTIANRGNYARWTANTTGAFSMTVGSHLTFTAPSAQILQGYGGTDRNGTVTNPLTVLLSRTDHNTEDDFQIVQS